MGGSHTRNSQSQSGLIGPYINSLRPRKNGRHFADDTLKWFFQNENVWMLIKISLKFVRKAPINNISSLVQIMAWRRPGDKPLSEPMMVSLLTHICVTRPQWVNSLTLSQEILRIDILSILSENAMSWMPNDHIDGRSKLVPASNGLALSGNKPLPEPMLTKFYDALWLYQWPLN